MIEKIVSTIAMAFIGIMLLNPITKIVQIATSHIQTSSPSSAVILGLIPAFFLIGLIAMIIANISSIIMDKGLEDVEEEIKEEYKPNDKQTYEEYVRERLRVERIMKYGWIGRWI